MADRTGKTTCGRHLRIDPKILYFGTPVALITSMNPDATPNLAPMSSVWTLGYTAVLGIGAAGQTLSNLQARPECVINLPSPDLWRNVERIAALTGRHPVPEERRAQYRYEPSKFAAAHLTPEPSNCVAPPRVHECALQLEAEVRDIRLVSDDEFAIVETHVVCVHAAREIVVPNTNHIDTNRWEPLLYVFRHYFGIGGDLGCNFRAET